MREKRTLEAELIAKLHSEEHIMPHKEVAKAKLAKEQEQKRERHHKTYSSTIPWRQGSDK
jgi:hypothetical protein